MFFQGKIFPFSRSYHKHEVGSHDQNLDNFKSKYMLFTLNILHSEQNSNNNKGFDEMSHNTFNNKKLKIHFSRLFKIFFSNSCVLKALRTTFLIQDYSRGFKACANPVTYKQSINPSGNFNLYLR